MASTVSESRGRPMGGQPGAIPYNPSLVFVLSRCVGHKVEVQTKTGCEYEGILHTPGLKNADIHMVLRKARKLKDGQAVGDVVERLIIPSGEQVQVIARDLPVLSASPPTPSAPQAGQLRVVLKDGEITEKGFTGDRDKIRNQEIAGLYGRQLTKWEPDDSEGGCGLEEETHQCGAWDQFKANEELFGVRTSFNMDLYTAKLDIQKSRFSLADANKLAKEMSKEPSNKKLGDGGILDDSGLDEETLFSSVLATPPAKAAPADSDPKERRKPPPPRQDAAPESQAPPPSNADETSAATPKKAAPPPVSAPAPAPAAAPAPLTGSSAPSWRRSEPISVPERDPLILRKEVNKVRHHLLRDKPLATSPLIKDHKNLEALDLHPAVPKVDKEVARQFNKFKQERKSRQDSSSFGQEDMFMREPKTFSTTVRVPVPREMQDPPPSTSSALNRQGSVPIKVESQIPAPVTTQRPVTPVGETFGGRPKTPVQPLHGSRSKTPVEEMYNVRKPSHDSYAARVKSGLQQERNRQHKPHMSEQYGGGRSRPESYSGRPRTPIQDSYSGRPKTPIQDSYSGHPRHPMPAHGGGGHHRGPGPAPGQPMVPGPPHENFLGPRRSVPSSIPVTSVPIMNMQPIPPPIIPPPPARSNSSPIPPQASRQVPPLPTSTEPIPRPPSSEPSASSRRSLNPFAVPFVPTPAPAESEMEGGVDLMDGVNVASSDCSGMSTSLVGSSPIPGPVSSPEPPTVRQPPPPPPPPPPPNPKPPSHSDSTQGSRSMKPWKPLPDHKMPPPHEVPPPPPQMMPNPMMMSGPMPGPPGQMPMMPYHPRGPGSAPGPGPGPPGPGGPEPGRPPMGPMGYMPYPMPPMPGVNPMTQPPPPPGMAFPYPPPPGMPGHYPMGYGPMPMMGPNGPMMPGPYPMMPPPMLPPHHPQSYPHQSRTGRSRGGTKGGRKPLQRHNSGHSTHSAHSVRSAHSGHSSHGGPPRG
ncbi:hypothetical protein BSKO_13646 [Bryopsis sp. KO-2023]|nr:hypothetical protein BSKO_13646 [Bryopsis sp. KO-2023]